MKILVVSGFLGAGKTTFIKELIRRTKKQPVILENEYGDNNLDSRSLSGGGALEILEFMEGCVCCTKKDSFVNTVLSISAAMDPEYLVIEPTGVGKLGNILSSIRRIEYERISLLPSVLVLAPRSINSYLKEFPEIYTDQVKHASKIVFSKSENESPELLQRVTEQIRAINDKAEIVSTHYTAMDDAWWNALFEGSEPDSDSDSDSVSGSGRIPGLEKTSMAAQSPEYRKRSLGYSLADAAQNLAQPQQITLKNVGLATPAELIILLEDILRGRFGYIPRAKGVVRVGAEHLRFDLADGLYAIIGADEKSPESQCTFIGNHLDAKGLRTRFQQA